MSSSDSLSVGSEGFAWLLYLAVRPRWVSTDRRLTRLLWPSGQGLSGDGQAA
jgi:hypothetical protein